jgi:hypothetical protein
MRESRTYGFVRGALSNGRPYRVRLLVRQQPVVTGIELVDLRKSQVRAQQIRQRAAGESLAVQTPLAARRQQSVRHQHH